MRRPGQRRRQRGDRKRDRRLHELPHRVRRRTLRRGRAACRARTATRGDAGGDADRRGSAGRADEPRHGPEPVGRLRRRRGDVPAGDRADREFGPSAARPARASLRRPRFRLSRRQPARPRREELRPGHRAEAPPRRPAHGAAGAAGREVHRFADRTRPLPGRAAGAEVPAAHRDTRIRVDQREARADAGGHRPLVREHRRLRPVAAHAEGSDRDRRSGRGTELAAARRTAARARHLQPAAAARSGRATAHDSRRRPRQHVS